MRSQIIHTRGGGLFTLALGCVHTRTRQALIDENIARARSAYRPAVYNETGGFVQCPNLVCFMP